MDLLIVKDKYFNEIHKELTNQVVTDLILNLVFISKLHN